MAVADRDVVPALDRLEEREELMGGIGQVGVGERNGAPGRGEDPGPNRRTPMVS